MTVMSRTFFALPLPLALGDGVIVLDAHRVEDAEAHHAGEDEEMLRRFDSPRKSRLEEMRGAIGRWITMRAAGGPQFAYALRDLSGVLMGGCEMRRATPDCAQVSYWLFPTFRGHGYANRALALLCAEADKIEALTRVEAHIDADNLASQGVALHNGFARDGTVADETWSGLTVTRLRFVRSVAPAADPTWP
jgi:RimJ/RimL family protein N-acetyltransferase